MINRPSQNWLSYKKNWGTHGHAQTQGHPCVPEITHGQSGRLCARLYAASGFKARLCAPCNWSCACSSH